MKLILTISFSLLSNVGYSQEGFKLILVDSIGRSDTVVFGMYNAATTGIDSAFGEINLFGSSMDSIEIRSVQRDMTNHLCLNNSAYGNDDEPFYFAENIDLKKDFRKNEAHNPANNFFEFKFNAHLYPLKIISDFTKWHPFGTYGIWIGILDAGCGIIFSSMGDENRIDTIIVDKNRTASSMIVKLDFEAGVRNISKDHQFELYPNPIAGISTLTINKIGAENSLINIYTITGCLV